MDDVDRILEQWATVRPDLDVGPMGLIGRLARLSAEITQAHERVFAAHGLTRAGFDVLATLRRSGPPYALEVKALLASTMVTSGTMTHRIDRLEQAGLAERRPNPEDGRGFVVALTEKGLAVIETAVTEHVANQHRLVAALSLGQRETLGGLLRLWLADLEGSASDR